MYFLSVDILQLKPDYQWVVICLSRMCSIQNDRPTKYTIRQARREIYKNLLGKAVWVSYIITAFSEKFSRKIFSLAILRFYSEALTFLLFNPLNWLIRLHKFFKDHHNGHKTRYLYIISLYRYYLELRIDTRRTPEYRFGLPQGYSLFISICLTSLTVSEIFHRHIY